MPRLSSSSLAVKCPRREPVLKKTGPGCRGLAGVVQLLGNVETVMERGRWVIASAQFADAMLLGECLRVGTRCLVGGPLCGRLSKVLILSEEGRRLHSLGDVDSSQYV